MKAYLLGGSGVGAGIAKELCCAQCGAKSNGGGSSREKISVFEHVVLKRAKKH